MSYYYKILVACMTLAVIRIQASDALTIHVTPSKKKFCLGEPILVQCELSNGNDAPLDLTGEWNLAEESWNFKIIKGKGKARDTWVFGGLSRRGGRTVIPAHGKVTLMLAVNEWLLLETGSHELVGDFKYEDGSASARFSVSIEKVSDLKLEKTLETLVDRFVDHETPGLWTELKLGLIYASRYSEATKSSLEKILKSGSKEQEILDAIGTVLHCVPQTSLY